MKLYSKQAIIIDTFLLEVVPTSGASIERIIHDINRQAKALNKNEITLYVRGNSIVRMNAGLMGNNLNQEQIDKYIFDIFKTILHHRDLEPNIISIQTCAFTDTEASAGKAALKLGIPTIFEFSAHYPYETQDEEGRIRVAFNETGFRKRFNDVVPYDKLRNTDRDVPNKELDNKIKKWLTSVGIEYQIVTEITDCNGAPIPANAKADIRRGIVEVVEGRSDINTLSEEAAHFLIELLDDDNPLLIGMLSAIEKTETYRKVLTDYSELYNGDENMLRKEAVSKSIAKAIVKSEEAQHVFNFKSWCKRAWKWIKCDLLLTDSSDSDREISPFVTAGNIILYNKTVSLGDIKSLNSHDIFYRVMGREEE